MYPKRLFLLVTMILLATLAHADSPTVMNYQGRLTDSAGVPVANAEYTLFFAIYDSATGGNSKWTEEQKVMTTDGLFSVLLGADTPLKDSVFNSPDRYLGITLLGDPEITPRTRLASVPYAFRSASGGSWIQTGNIVSLDDPDDTVGIGTRLPTTKFDVYGNARIEGKLSCGPGSVNTGWYSFVAGTNNSALGNYSVVPGGNFNVANEYCSVVGGGLENAAMGFNSTVSGGQKDSAIGYMSYVGGGFNNIAGDSLAVVVGGYINRAAGVRSFVGGGLANYANGRQATVVGGWVNVAEGHVSVICGGSNDSATGDWSVVGGGYQNKARDTASVIAGGIQNLATGVYSTVGGGGGFDPGAGNTAEGYAATVAGGQSNLAQGVFSSAGGGKGNTAADTACVVGGGLNNEASSNFATVGGGNGNVASGFSSTVGGGSDNEAAGIYSTVSGGTLNHATDNYATASGGLSNMASGNIATVSGGVGNLASGNGATVPGGESNTASGTTSFAAGRFAQANHSGCFVWSDASGGFFTSTANDQFLIEAAGGVGINTNAPDVPLHIEGGSDVSLGGGGYLITGPVAGANVTIDNNEIMARNNGAASPLYLNTNGGYVLFNGSVESRVGIGLTSPTRILHIKQNSATDPIADAWTTYSSRRWKKEIKTIANPLDIIGRLDGVRYKWKADDRDDIGLIAEDVGKILPEIVQYEENGVDAVSVDYSRLVPLLIEGLKEQQKQIEELRKRLSNLESGLLAVKGP